MKTKEHVHEHDVVYKVNAFQHQQRIPPDSQAKAFVRVDTPGIML